MEDWGWGWGWFGDDSGDLLCTLFLLLLHPLHLRSPGLRSWRLGTPALTFLTSSDLCAHSLPDTWRSSRFSVLGSFLIFWHENGPLLWNFPRFLCNLYSRITCLYGLFIIFYFVLLECYLCVHLFSKHLNPWVLLTDFSLLFWVGAWAFEFFQCSSGDSRIKNLWNKDITVPTDSSELWWLAAEILMECLGKERGSAPLAAWGAWCLSNSSLQNKCWKLFSLVTFFS